MKVADVLALLPASIAYSPSCGDDAAEFSLIEKYLNTIQFKMPSLIAKSASSLLLYKRESEAHRTPNDEYYITDDPKVRKP